MEQGKGAKSCKKKKVKCTKFTIIWFFPSNSSSLLVVITIILIFSRSFHLTLHIFALFVYHRSNYSKSVNVESFQEIKRSRKERNEKVRNSKFWNAFKVWEMREERKKWKIDQSTEGGKWNWGRGRRIWKMKKMYSFLKEKRWWSKDDESDSERWFKIKIREQGYGIEERDGIESTHTFHHSLSSKHTQSFLDANSP